MLENGESDTDVMNWIKQHPQTTTDPYNKPRNLNVKVDVAGNGLRFAYGTKNGRRCVTGIIIEGCMTRDTGAHDLADFDEGYDFQGKTCEHARRAAESEKSGKDSLRIVTRHLIYSSSSSSSNWGVG